MSPGDVGVRLLLAVALIIAASTAVGSALVRIGQPRVMGEIIAGILLGPSLLGQVWPEAEQYLFPPDVIGGLRAIAQIGLVLFMFLVGLGLDMEHLRGQGHRAVVISHASIVAPFALGALLAVWLHPRLGGDSDLLGFVLFIGAAMSITAFPVLVRILQDTGLDSTRIGAMALTCAAVDDVTAWCVLAVVVAIVQSSGPGDVVLTVLSAVVFTSVMLVLIRPLLKRVDRIPLPVAVAFALLCAWGTEIIGIHAIFGAFLAGTVLPRTPSIRDAFTSQLETAIKVVLLPVFFAVVGLSTQFGLLDSWSLWAVALAVVAVAVAGKVGGSSLAARSLGESWTDALTLGVLMNTRGLTELVILAVGLELGVINDTAFTVMVLMALVTTLMAAPLLRLLGVGLEARRTSSPDQPIRSNG